MNKRASQHNQVCCIPRSTKPGPASPGQHILAASTSLPFANQLRTSAPATPPNSALHLPPQKNGTCCMWQDQFHADRGYSCPRCWEKCMAAESPVRETVPTKSKVYARTSAQPVAPSHSAMCGCGVQRTCWALRQPSLNPYIPGEAACGKQQLLAHLLIARGVCSCFARVRPSPLALFLVPAA